MAKGTTLIVNVSSTSVRYCDNSAERDVVKRVTGVVVGTGSVQVITCHGVIKGDNVRAFFGAGGLYRRVPKNI